MTAVSGTVVAIDRKEKHVVLDSGLIVPYDTLVLTPGLQVGAAACCCETQHLGSTALRCRPASQARRATWWR